MHILAYFGPLVHILANFAYFGPYFVIFCKILPEITKILDFFGQKFFYKNFSKKFFWEEFFSKFIFAEILKTFNLSEVLLKCKIKG